MSEFLINFKINIIFDFLLEIRLKIWYYIQEIKNKEILLWVELWVELEQ